MVIIPLSKLSYCFFKSNETSIANNFPDSEVQLALKRYTKLCEVTMLKRFPTSKQRLLSFSLPRYLSST